MIDAPVEYGDIEEFAEDAIQELHDPETGETPSGVNHGDDPNEQDPIFEDSGWRARRRRQRQRERKRKFHFRTVRQGNTGGKPRPFRAAAARSGDPDPKDVVDGHIDSYNREALQQLIKEESGDGGKRIAPAAEVRNSTGPTQERWKTAAEAELSGNFLKCGAFHESTPAEVAAYGRPLPMLCVWSEAPDVKKCRACVCGNFAKVDPLQQSWTAQAEPSSLIVSLKLACNKKWIASKHEKCGQCPREQR